MDEKDFFYNPWINLGLGILGGNPGESQSDAFANAMRGGQTSLKSVQEDRLLRKKQKEEEALNQIKKDEYERLKRANELIRAQAGSMANRGGPEADFWRAVEQDPKTGTDIYDTLAKMRYYQGILGTYGKGGGGGSGSDLFKLGYNKLTNPQLEQLKAEAATKLGEDWYNLPPEEQTSIAMELGQRTYQGAAQGIPYDVARDKFFNQLTSGREDKPMDKLFGLIPLPWTGGPSYRKAITPPDAAPVPAGVITDSAGVQWRYKGTGDPKDKANYTRVK